MLKKIIFIFSRFVGLLFGFKMKSLYAALKQFVQGIEVDLSGDML